MAPLQPPFRCRCRHAKAAALLGLRALYLPIRELLIASHILPWRSHEAERLNVRNGIALNRLHDAAFDQGLISFDDELRMILSPKLRGVLPQQSVSHYFESCEGKALELPVDGIPPDALFLSKHRLRYKLVN